MTELAAAAARRVLSWALRTLVLLFGAPVTLAASATRLLGLAAARVVHRAACCCSLERAHVRDLSLVATGERHRGAELHALVRFGAVERELGQVCAVDELRRDALVDVVEAAVGGEAA